MSMINKEINDFSVQAYQNGEFKTITKNDIMKEWSLFFLLSGRLYLCMPYGAGRSSEQISRVSKSRMRSLFGLYRFSFRTQSMARSL